MKVNGLNIKKISYIKELDLSDEMKSILDAMGYKAEIEYICDDGIKHSALIKNLTYELGINYACDFLTESKY